jgi:hypothetical protein
LRLPLHTMVMALLTIRIHIGMAVVGAGDVLIGATGMVAGAGVAVGGGGAVGAGEAVGAVAGTAATGTGNSITRFN